MGPEQFINLGGLGVFAFVVWKEVRAMRLSQEKHLSSIYTLLGELKTVFFATDKDKPRINAEEAAVNSNSRMD